jgi:hypothetical protein
MDLINKDGSINTHHEFTFTKGKSAGRRLRIIATRSDGIKAIHCVDTIKNLDTGNKTELKRSMILQLYPVVIA